MISLSNELFDLIIGFGFMWITNFRVLNKQLKEKVDKMVCNISIACVNQNRHNDFIWKHSLYDITIKVKERNQLLSLSIITEIMNVLTINRGQKISNFHFISVYDTVYYASTCYKLKKIIYERLEKLFDQTFADCVYEGSFCIKRANYIMRFYRCIFGSLIYYTNHLKLKNVNTILQERMEIAINKTRYKNEKM